MPTSKSSRSVHFGSDIPIRKSSPTVATGPDTPDLQSSHTKTSNPELRQTSNSSLWKLPGLDKDTFYASALYLHASVGELKSKTWNRGGTKTPQQTRDFLDRLADCFARSKLQDARDHVSATAMVRNEEQKKITLYIAKNHSEKGCEPIVSQGELSEIANENNVFAKELVEWFNDLTHKVDSHPNIFKTMCKFSQSRLEYYIRKISESDIDDLERVVLYDLEKKFRDGWEVAKFVINECQLYQNAKSNLIGSGGQESCLLATHAHLAGQTRKYHGFRILADKVETSPSGSKLKGLAEAAKWINYLGRLYAAHVSFSEFCGDQAQSGYSFHFRLLPSLEDEWNGDSYIKKIQSWTGDLGLTDARGVSKTVDGQIVVEVKTLEAHMNEIVKTTGNKARVHCEMQLMMHFSQPNAEKCLDYFGCSKKSCWLCWQMMRESSKFSMKDTHRKLYPRWAFPFEFSPPQRAVAEGLRTAYNEMLSSIQNMVINQKPLDFHESYPQSSARNTPHHGRAPASDNPDWEPELGPFSGSPIIGSDKFPAMVVPALHLPASGSPTRQVEVRAYEKEQPDHDHIPLTSQEFGNKRIVFAFQLITKPESYLFCTGVDELDQGYWHRELIPPWFKLHGPELQGPYEIWYRTANALAPNPHILLIWKKLHGEEDEDFPWRGDVFITATDLVPPEEGYLRTSPIDASELFRGLEDLFRSEGAEYLRETVQTDLRDTSEWLRHRTEWIESMEAASPEVREGLSSWYEPFAPGIAKYIRHRWGGTTNNGLGPR